MRTCATPWMGSGASEPDEAEELSDSTSSDETASPSADSPLGLQPSLHSHPSLASHPSLSSHPSFGSQQPSPPPVQIGAAVAMENAAANEALGKKAEAIRLLEALMLVSPNDVTTRARLISLSAE